MQGDYCRMNRIGIRFSTEVQIACQLDRDRVDPPPECRQGGSSSRPEGGYAGEEFAGVPPNVDGLGLA